MQRTNYVSIQKLCFLYKVPASFINIISEYDFIEIIKINNVPHVHQNQIRTLEKIMRLHFDLDINMEGIDVVQNLLKQVDNMRREITVLKNRLNRYEKF